ncbi:type IX secretion system anionic LPS delivery protein PorZ [Mangrovivirga cuniculi]|nr:T9SS type A sorting domain-containing protein [Mangrovivirga cuniculi]
MKRDVENAFLPALKILTRFLRFILPSLFFLNISAQNNIPTGTWEAHYSYNTTEFVVGFNDEIIGISNPGIFSYVPIEGWISKVNTDELPAENISSAFSSSDYLIYGFADGSLYKVQKNEIIINNELVSPSTNFYINSIKEFNGLLYLATDEGLVLANLEDLSIRDAFLQIGDSAKSVKVFDITFLSDSIYISTDEGIKAASRNSNLADFNQWKVRSEIAIKEFFELGGEVLAITKAGGLLKKSIDGTWSTVENQPVDGWIAGSTYNSQLFLVNENNVYTWNNGVFTNIADLSSTIDPLDIVVNNDIVFLGTRNSGLIRIDNNNTTSLKPDGPENNFPSAIRFTGSNLFALNSNEAELISYLENSEWKETSLFDAIITDVAYHNQKYYFASISRGLISDLENPVLLTGETLEIDVIAGEGPNDYEFTAITSFADKLLFAQTNSTAYLYTEDLETTTPFPKADSRLNYIRNLKIVDGNIIALTSQNPDGKIVIINPEDQEFRILTSSENNGGLPGTIYNLGSDSDGRIWIASNNGVWFLDVPFGVFDFVAMNASRPIIDGRYLLEGRKVNDLFIDTGDRLWTATALGIRLFDSNLEEELAFFNTENSLLPSNNVLQLEYDPSSGKVYALTDRGIVAYQSDATLPATDYNSVNIYPNPFSVERNEIITISDIKGNSNIKITTASGVFVDEIESKGGSASWNPPSNIPPGVYLFFMADQFYEDGYIGKAVIIP